MAKTQQTTVYELQEILDDPRFAGFNFAKGVKSVLGNPFPIEDFQGSDPEKPPWKPPVLAKVWKRPKVVGNVRPFNDYPCLGLLEPVFSEKAVNCLRPILEPNGELLPLDSDLGNYWLFNVHTICTALDVKRSKVAWWGLGRPDAIDIKWFAFNEQKLRGLTIFKLREWTTPVFVTQAFRDRVEECGLNGFHFVKVWPYPRGVEWRQEEAKARRARAKKKGDLRGETLILRFRLAGTKPTATEKRLMKRFTEELITTLAGENTLTAPYYGTLESVELDRGEWRMFLSCGSVEKLATYLDSWLKACPWPGQLHIVKRRGHLFDGKAKEERIAIK